jgi:hypothetical protein
LQQAGTNHENAGAVLVTDYAANDNSWDIVLYAGRRWWLYSDEKDFRDFAFGDHRSHRRTSDIDDANRGQNLLACIDQAWRTDEEDHGQLGQAIGGNQDFGIDGTYAKGEISDS